MFFNEHSEILVEGIYSAEDLFEAEAIIVKCPSKYQAEEKETRQSCRDGRGGRRGGQGGGDRPSGAKGWEDRSYGGGSSSDSSSDRDDGRSRRRRGAAPEDSSGFSGDENSDYGGAEG